MCTSDNIWNSSSTNLSTSKVESASDISPPWRKIAETNGMRGGRDVTSHQPPPIFPREVRGRHHSSFLATSALSFTLGVHYLFLPCID